MPGFLVRMLCTAAGLWLASLLLSGITIADVGTLLISALLLGVVNAIVRPIVVVLTLPITLLTLGLFLLVVNALMLELVAWMVSGFHVAGLFSAIGGSLVISATSWVASSYIGPRGRFEVLIVERRT